MKREGLEEAKVSRVPNATGGPETHCQSLSLSSENTSASTSWNGVLLRDLVRRQNVTTTSIPLHPSNIGVFEVQFLSSFWEYYVPSRSSAQNDSPCYWLQQTICLADPPLALRLSLVALAMTRIGWLHGDDATIRKGRAIYGHALRELQKALSNERSRRQDETMATCVVMALYEVSRFFLIAVAVLTRIMQFSESTSTSCTGYISHVEGLTHLLTMRGSDRYGYRSPLARSMLEETRLKAVCHI